MGSVTFFDSTRMQAIEDGTVTSGLVDQYGNLILTHHDGSTVNAGNVVGPEGPQGDKGDTGPQGDPYQFVAGIIEPFGGSVPPAGWMICNGSPISRTAYSALFAAIGTTYGAGDGSTTFNLPDFRGVTLVGLDTSQTEFNTLGKTGGEKTHVLTIAEMPSHNHPQNVSANPNSGGTGVRLDYNSDTTGAGTFNQGIFTEKTGGDGAHNNLQPYRVVNYIISLGINGGSPGGTPIEVQYRLRGTTAERDALYGIPTTTDQKVALANQKVVWYNTDLDWEEEYFATSGLTGLLVKGLYPGGLFSGVGDISGWYPTGPGPECAMQPTSTSTANGGSWVGGWNGRVFRRGGDDYFLTNEQYIKIMMAGFYDLSWWTQVSTGAGVMDLYSFLLDGSTDAIVWSSNQGGPPLTSVYIRNGGTYESQLVGPNLKFAVKAISGSAPVHNITQQGSADGTRGVMRARYLRPPLVSD